MSEITKPILLDETGQQIVSKLNDIANKITDTGVTKSGDNTLTGVNTFNANVKLNSTLTDNNASVGVAGQVLTSTGTGVEWSNDTGAVWGGIGGTLSNQTDLVTQLATKVDKQIKGTNGTAEIFNESDGGGSKFYHNDGLESYVGVNDGGSTGLAAQIYADKYVDGKWQGAKLDVTNGGMYYTVGNKSFAERAIAENELAVKKDIKTYLADESTLTLDTNNQFSVKAIAINQVTDLQTALDAKATTDSVTAEETRARGAEETLSDNKANKTDTLDVSNFKGDAYTSNQPYNFSYFFATEPSADKITVKSYSCTLDGNYTHNTYSLDVNGATTTAAGLLTASDKTRLDGLYDNTTIDSKLANKLDLLPGDEKSGGNAYNLPYYFYTVPETDKIVVHTQTVTLDGKKTYGDYSLDVPAATESAIGLMTAADKTKLDNLNKLYNHHLTLSNDTTVIYLTYLSTSATEYTAETISALLTSIDSKKIQATGFNSTENASINAVGGSEGKAVIYYNLNSSLTLDSITTVTDFVETL